jgi:glycosyltransferase involved in cell wall biosynthesis
MLVLLGQGGGSPQWLDRLPAGTTLIDIATLWPDLSPSGRNVITLKLIQHCAERARIHLKPCRYAEDFSRTYLPVLSDHARIYYRFCDVLDIVDGGQVIRPNEFSFLSDMIEHLDHVVADNDHVIRFDTDRIGVDNTKWQRIYARQTSRLSLPQAAERARAAPPRILWAGRMDKQKRPDLIAPIAARLARLRPDAEIHVYGGALLDDFDPVSLGECTNVRVRGPFSCFDEIAQQGFACFLYTSLFDGLPNVLLEAIAAGLPVVAPDVGGVSELIDDGRTGCLLAADPDTDALADTYACALAALLGSPDLRERLSVTALEQLGVQHAADSHRRRVAELFGLASDVR